MMNTESKMNSVKCINFVYTIREGFWYIDCIDHHGWHNLQTVLLCLQQ